MIRPEWPLDKQQYDRYNAFHVGVSKGGLHKPSSYGSQPLVLFDTGELILTKAEPDPGERGEYKVVDVELTFSNDMGGYWTPDGMAVKKAWFSGASQWALVDGQSGRAVRTNGASRTRSGRDFRPNIPARFQECSAYIGGPGCHPVGSAPFVLRPTIRYMPQHMRDHVATFEQSFRAAMTLTENPVTNDTIIVTQPLAFEKVMALESWEDLDDFQQRCLWKFGVDRPVLQFDHLLTSPPRG